MDTTTLIDHLAGQGVALADAAARAGWDAPVPRSDWDVRQLVTHIGGVHRWAADVVRTASPTLDLDSAALVGSGPPDDELLDWFSSGHAELVVTLGAAPADLAAATFLPADSPLHFWSRRQAHETAIHRADAAGAAGAVATFEAAFAQDGIAEVLHGFARRRSSAIAEAGAIGLAASDGPSWSIELGGERIEAVADVEVAGSDVVVGGRSSDLYLWLWNRPADVELRGDQDLAALWAQHVRVTWS